jgi:two-component system, cell cycle response regulator CpdR
VPVRPRSTPFRVLVVDPDDTTCGLLTGRLAGEGFEVVCAASDADAYAALQAHGPALDALVTDTNLGSGTTGFDVARDARRRHPEVAVIFLSHAARESVERHGVPGAAHIARPYDPGLLILILRELAAG